MIIVDTNILIHLTIRGPETETAEAVFTKDPDWGAPVLWRSEYRNVLATSVRAGHFRLSEAITFVSLAQKTVARREFVPDTEEVLRLAEQSGRSAYDCEFVSIALKLGIHLITADQRLGQSFPKIAIHPKEFAG